MDLRTRQNLVSALADSLGPEQASQVVRRAFEECALGEHVTSAEALGALRRIEGYAGSAGLAAKLIIARIERSEAEGAPSTRSSLRPPAELIPLAEVAAQLAVAVGPEKAEALVGQACVVLGVVTSAVTGTDAVKLLDQIEVAHPPASVAARFAKVKFLLK